MYVCMHACMCMHVCVCMYVCMDACMYVCLYVCMYVFIKNALNVAAGEAAVPESHVGSAP